MFHRGKIIGGVIGMMIAGPFGLVIGVLIGHKLDKKRMRRRIARRFASTPDGIAAAVVVLAAKLAKADGRVSEDEVAALRRLLAVPPEDVPCIAALWREARATSAGYAPYAEHLARLYRYEPEMLRRILAVLHAVAEADGVVSASERWVLDDLARIFGVAPVAGPALPLHDLLRGATGAGVERAYRMIFDGRAMDRPHQGLRGSGQSPTARLEEGVRDIAMRPGGRPLLAAGAGVAGAVLAGATLPLEGLFAYSEALLTGAAAVGSAAAAYVALPKPHSPLDELAAMARAARVDPDLVVATVQETAAKLTAIAETAAPLDPPIRDRVEAICGHAREILDGVRRDPRQVGRARPFLDHYLTATLDVVQRFAGLRARQGAAGRAEELGGRLEALLGDIEAMFRRHIDSSAADDSRELEVSIDSLQRMIRSEGA